MKNLDNNLIENCKYEPIYCIGSYQIYKIKESLTGLIGWIVVKKGDKPDAKKGFNKLSNALQVYDL